MDRVDDMSQDIVKYNTYCRNLSKQQQQKQQVRSPLHTFFLLGGIVTAVAFQPEFSFRVAETSNYMPENKSAGPEEWDWVHVSS